MMGIGKAHIVVDLKKLNLRSDEIVVLQLETNFIDIKFVDSVKPSYFRVLPDGKIIFNKLNDFAIARRQ